jgi:hypothetical protein
MGADPVHRSTTLRGREGVLPSGKSREAKRPKISAVSGRGISVGARHSNVSGPKSVEPGVSTAHVVRPTQDVLQRFALGSPVHECSQLLSIPVRQGLSHPSKLVLCILRVQLLVLCKSL